VSWRAVVSRRAAARAAYRGWRGSAAIAVTAVVVSLSLAGCGGEDPVRVTGVPTPTGAQRAACDALLASLPASLGAGLARRQVSPADAAAAAYGSAPAVLTCGASGVARTYRPTAMLSDVEGVGWFAEEMGDTVRYSTPTRTPQVVLTLPADIQAFEVLVALGPAVRTQTRSTTA
jgi:hypothetical protein